MYRLFSVRLPVSRTAAWRTSGTSKTVFLAFLSAGLALHAAAPGIVTRHDVADSAYVQKAADLPSYCRMMMPDGGGALIAPSWVLTAAHLVPAMRPGHAIRCGAEELVAKNIVFHPQYRENVGRHDLALVQLAAPSRQQPLSLWRTSDESAHLINLIGHWQGGNGLTGVSPTINRELKGATNRVTSADEHWLSFTMDRPGTASTTPLEGVSGGGDSGAPAYVIRDGKTYILGVGSRNADTNEDGIEQNYGDTDKYVRVSRYAPWIERVIEGRETAASRLLLRNADTLPYFGALAGLAFCILAWRVGLAFRARPNATVAERGGEATVETGERN